MANIKKDYGAVRVTKAKAIREKCLDCCCGQESEVRLCPITGCPLWRYRMGYEAKDELNPLLSVNPDLIEPSAT